MVIVETDQSKPSKWNIDQSDEGKFYLNRSEEGTGGRKDLAGELGATL